MREGIGCLGVTMFIFGLVGGGCSVMEAWGALRISPLGEWRPFATIAAVCLVALGLGLWAMIASRDKGPPK